VRTHAVLLLSVSPPSECEKNAIVVRNEVLLCSAIDPVTLTFDVWTAKQYQGTRVSKDHFLHQVWTLWEYSFLSYAADKQTNRRTRKSIPTLTDRVIMLSRLSLVVVNRKRTIDDWSIFCDRNCVYMTAVDMRSVRSWISIHMAVVILRSCSYSRETDTNADWNVWITRTYRRCDIDETTNERSGRHPMYIRPRSAAQLQLKTVTYCRCHSRRYCRSTASIRRSDITTIVVAKRI